ncbi:MAG: DUF1298 domain-containing protein [Acidobacteria bacterium]|nr:DUF1298 domain-containing protein [Acidobacteriota bacterium]
MFERIASNDVIWLQDSPANLMVINAVVVTEPLGVETLRDAFQRKIFEGEGRERFERLRCRIAPKGGRLFWESDPDFDLSRHIVPARDPSLRTLAEVQAYVGVEASRKLPRGRPRWEIQVIEAFEGGASALLIRIHHSIADGMALVSLMFALMDEDWHRGDGVARGSLPAGPSRGQRLLRALLIAASAPGVLLRRLFWVPDRQGLHGPSLSGEKRVAWTEPLDLAVIKGAKERTGATVNDVLMASVSGAFSRYLGLRGEKAPPHFRVSMPVNVRPPWDPLVLENRFAAVPLTLPAGGREFPQRILAVKARMDELKRSVAPLVVYVLQRLLVTLLPGKPSCGLIDFLANKCTAVVTNVPGPQREISIGGSRVRSLLFWVPQRARIGVGISILSFAGKVQVGVMTDTAIEADPERLVQCFEEEFQALKTLP